MTDASLIGLLGQGGPLALVIAYLIWRQNRDDTAREKADTAKAIYDQARLDADKSLAASLAALTVTIQQMTRA